VEKEFQEHLSTTVGSDAIRYVHDPRCEIVFTDTAGEERFKAMTSSFYRNCSAILFVYDVTDATSFSEVMAFLQEANRFNERSVKCLVASKCDLDKVVQSEAGREFAEKESMDGFFEVSSKSGAGVTELVEALVEKLLAQESGKAAAGAAASAAPAGTVKVVEHPPPASSQKKCFI